MKVLFASDIHGSAYYCEKLIDTYRDSGADRLVLLGDLLYHGPRNDLPREYAPKEVISMLNAVREEIYAVRGNCEAEVDQMVLEFPVMADYFILSDGRFTFFATHGHLFHEGKLPPLKKGDVLICGHTHIYCAQHRKRTQETEEYYLLNTGSVSLPKAGNPPTYGIYEDGCFEIRDFEGNRLTQINLAQE